MKKHQMLTLFAAVFLINITIMVISGPAAAQSSCTHYASPGQSLAGAVGQLHAGDVLCLKDGTYRDSIRVDISGAPGRPITIRAENDGMATVDGEFKRRPFVIDGRNIPGGIHDIVIEGIVFRNSSGHVFAISGGDRILVKRVSGYEATVDPTNGKANNHVFVVHDSVDILLEDTIAGGIGRDMYNILGNQKVKIRRCYGQWRFYFYNGVNGGHFMQIYGSSETIVENCVGTDHPDADQRYRQGIIIWANKGQVAHRNRIHGSVMFDLKTDFNDNGDSSFGAASKHRRTFGSRFSNNVSINNNWGGKWYGHTDLIYDQMTFVDSYEGWRYYEWGHGGFPKDPDYESNGDLRNSVILNATNGINCSGKDITDGRYLTGCTHAYNNLYNVGTSYIKTSKGVGEISIDPGYNTAKYGRGAYLIRPANLRGKGENGADMGAEVLYRYVDGVLTDEPLWPWPMEDRVQKELGVSVTWESGDGLWRTLDGVYDGQPVNQPPSVRINANPSSGQAPLSITFDGSGSIDSDGTIITYSWNFGDGTTATGLNTDHTFAVDGDYTVTLTVTDDDGQAATGSVIIRVGNDPGPSPDSFDAFRTSTPIQVDGVLVEDSWSQAVSVSFSNPSRSDNQVRVSTLWDELNLYFAYEVNDKNVEAVNQQLHRDDGAEVYLDTQNNKSTQMDNDDYHFMININDLSDPAGIDVRTATTTQGYIMEIAIPWNLINTVPSQGKTMGLLLGNDDRDNGNSVQFDWLDLIETGSYARPHLWGEIVLAGESVADCDGDLNGDSRIDVADLQMMVNIILRAGSEIACADLDENGNVNVADLQALINRILLK